MRGKVSVCHHKQDEKKTHKCPLDQVYGKGGLLKKKLKAAADRTLKELWSAFGKNCLSVFMAWSICLCILSLFSYVESLFSTTGCAS